MADIPTTYYHLAKVTGENGKVQIELILNGIKPLNRVDLIFPDGEVNTTLLWGRLATLLELEDYKLLYKFAEILICVIDDYQRGRIK